MAVNEINATDSAPPTSLQRYVRVRRVIREQFIEFDFAVGDPSLYVELVLPKAAFDTFCDYNNVIHMNEEQASAVDLDMEKWRYGKPGSR